MAFNWEEWYEQFKPKAGMHIEWDSLEHLARMLSRIPECLIVEVGSVGAASTDHWTGTRFLDWMAQFSEKRSTTAVVLETNPEAMRAGMEACKNVGFVAVSDYESGVKALASMERADCVIVSAGNATKELVTQVWGRLRPLGILAVKGAPGLEIRDLIHSMGGALVGPKGIDIWLKAKTEPAK